MFLASGFHAATIEELEAATGMSWEAIRARFGDKEGLFFAATRQRLDALRGGVDAADGELDAIADLLRRVTSPGANVMLRAQHRDALGRLTAIVEAMRS